MKISKIHYIIAAILIVLACSGIWMMNNSLTKENIESSYPSYYSPLGKIILKSSIPATPTNVILYRVTPVDTDIVQYRVPQLMDFRESVTSEIDAPLVAPHVLSGYGGLPVDAILANNKTIYAKQSGKQIPIMTQIQYKRNLGGMPVVGPGARLSISLGENGELLELSKVWRTVNRTGTVKIIPVQSAIEKLTRGDILGDRIKCLCDLNVDTIKLGYYEKGVNATQEFLEPVWIFSGTTSTGDFWSYSIYSRQFSNFTATPTSGIAPLVVTFNETSDISPTKWLWEFGDDTNSTEQNPVHQYQNAGTYNVTLTSWTDLGSDSISKVGYISVLPNQIQNRDPLTNNQVGKTNTPEGKQ
jgi:hypothetical protein